jgi:hypothetical protein
MKHTAKVLLWGALVGALWVSPRALAQQVTHDHFHNGFKHSVPWTWMVTGNDPADTEDPTNYFFTDHALNIMAQAGSLYGSNNNAHNIASLLILDQPANWYVETAVQTDWSMASLNTYVHAGLVFFADADNYFSFYNNRNAGNSPLVQVSSTFETLGSPNYGGISSADWTPTTDFVKLKVKGTPTQVTFMYKRVTDATWQTAGTVSGTNLPAVFAFMNSLTGKQVGLETDTGGGFNDSPFAFGFFRTNLVVSGQ